MRRFSFKKRGPFTLATLFNMVGKAEKHASFRTLAKRIPRAIGETILEAGDDMLDAGLHAGVALGEFVREKVQDARKEKAQDAHEQQDATPVASPVAPPVVAGNSYY